MKRDLTRAFAAITARLEDLSAVAMEGQRRDTSPDMHRVLLGELRSGMAIVEETLRSVAAALNGPSL